MAVVLRGLLHARHTLVHDFKVPVEEFFRQENPDPKVVEQLRSLGCKEFGIEAEADLDDFIRTEIPQFELVRALATLVARASSRRGGM